MLAHLHQRQSCHICLTTTCGMSSMSCHPQMNAAISWSRWQGPLMTPLVRTTAVHPSDSTPTPSLRMQHVKKPAHQETCSPSLLTKPAHQETC